MAFSLSTTSIVNLNGVHPDLIKVVKRAVQLSSIDFKVLEGLRTLARQKVLLECGASQTMQSRHIASCNSCGLGCAVDLGAVVGKEVRWDWPLYFKIADAMKKAAKELGVKIEWGGDWRTFKDGPHFQLAWKDYP
jgi:peptidoglycan LD-endopeptidase CwlK